MIVLSNDCAPQSSPANRSSLYLARQAAPDATLSEHLEPCFEHTTMGSLEMVA